MADSENFWLQNFKPSHVQQFLSTPQILQSDTSVHFIPSPVKGWNNLQNQASMDPENATILQNWVCRPKWIEVRGGYNAWAQGLGAAPVETLACYRPAGAAQTLFAAIGSEIWNCSNYGLPT